MQANSHQTEPRRDGRSVSDALAQVFSEDYNRLVNAAAALSNAHCEAEEVVQEAFLRCYVNWSRDGVPLSPGAYLRTAVVNLAHTRGRRQVIGARALERLRSRYRLAQPRQDAVDTETCDDELTSLVRSLPSQQRACVVHRFYFDHSVVETASLMCISEGAVKTHTSRALRSLEQRLEREREAR